MTKFIFTLSILGSLFNSWAQKNVFLNINPVFNSSTLQMGELLTHGSGESYMHWIILIIMCRMLSLPMMADRFRIALDDVYLVEPDNHTLYLGSLLP